jgi:hypothetical protein
MRWETSPQVLDFFANFVSASGCTYFLYLSTLDKTTDLSLLHRGDELLVRQMHSGRLPIALFMLNTVPLIVASTGLTIKYIKWLTFYNFIIFCFMLRNIIDFTICKDDDATCSRDEEEMAQLHLRLDIITFVTMMSLAYFSCIPAADTANKFIKRMESDIRADAILNNVLQNSIAGVAGLLEMEQAETAAKQCERCGVRYRLTQARHQLMHGMRWCMSRQVMIELTSGDYKSLKNRVNLSYFLKDMSICVDKCDVNSSNNTEVEDVARSSNGSIRKGDTNREVLFDESMARIAIETAIYNASCHGDGRAITLGAKVHEEGVSD